MYIYESHMGGLYSSKSELSFKETYCEQCGDHDWLRGIANTRKEAWDLLENETATFDFSMCDNCIHNGDYDYCDEKCEDYLMHSGGLDFDYVISFIEENWDE